MHVSPYGVAIAEKEKRSETTVQLNHEHTSQAVLFLGGATRVFTRENSK